MAIASATRDAASAPGMDKLNETIPAGSTAHLQWNLASGPSFLKRPHDMYIGLSEAKTRRDAIKEARALAPLALPPVYNNGTLKIRFIDFHSSDMDCPKE